MNNKLLPRGEERVMSVIWSSEEELSLPEINRRVNDRFGTSLKPQTISTFLTRLRARGYISMYRKGRSFNYTVLIGKEDYLRMLMSDICDLWFNRNVDTMIDKTKEYCKRVK